MITPGRYCVRPATDTDLDDIIALRTEAEEWLARRQIRQWTRDYSDYARAVLSTSVRAGATWVLEHARDVVATISLPDRPDLDFWDWLPDPNDAVYPAKLIVARAHAHRDLGGAILNWVGRRAAAASRPWVRIDVRRDNYRLHDYYLAHGFTYLRTYHAPDRRTESGWLAQRPARVQTPCRIRVDEAAPAAYAAAAHL